MVKSKGPISPRTAGAAKQEAYGADHEALLLAAYHELPRVLVEELHTSDPLNAALREKAPARKSEIEEALAKVELHAEQVALWHAVPDIQFRTSGNIPAPKVTLGLTLYRWLDGRGDRKKVPEAQCVVDFCIDLKLPCWNTGYLRTPDPNKPLNRAGDALSGAGHSLSDHRVLGLVFTREVTLGQAIREIERVRDAGGVDSVRNGYRAPVYPFIICITARQELFDVLSDKVDVMLVDEEYNELAFDLGFLLKEVSAR